MLIKYGIEIECALPRIVLYFRTNEMAVQLPFAAKALLAVACLVVFATSAAASDVVDATDANFNDVVKSSEMVLMEFYAPWCGHCKKLAPEWEEAATALKGTAVLAKMDATEQQETPTKFNIRGYPTIKIFREGEVAGEYDGKRDAAGIVAWVKANTGPAITTIATAAELDAAKSEHAVIVVAFVADTTSNTFLTFETVAKLKRSQYRFFVADPTLAGEGQEGKIVVFKQFDDAVEVYGATEVTDAKDVTKFIQNAGIRLFDQMGPENYQDYMTRNVPIGWLFAIPSDEASDSARAAVQAVAAEFKGRLSLVWIDASKYGGMATRVGLKGTKYPAFAVDFQEKHFAFDEKAEITEEALRDFLGKYVAGEIAETLMTEEAPEQHTVEGLTTVVGSTFKELVQESTDADVFIEFYAPWCGHCKKLAPVFKSLAAKTADVEGIRIAMIDATANDFDKNTFAVQGFPTIVFVPKNGGTPITFEEERTIDGMLSFIKKHSSANFDNVKDEL